MIPVIGVPIPVPAPVVSSLTSPELIPSLASDALASTVSSVVSCVSSSLVDARVVSNFNGTKITKIVNCTTTLVTYHITGEALPAAPPSLLWRLVLFIFSRAVPAPLVVLMLGMAVLWGMALVTHNGPRHSYVLFFRNVALVPWRLGAWIPRVMRAIGVLLFSERYVDSPFLLWFFRFWTGFLRVLGEGLGFRGIGRGRRGRRGRRGGDGDGNDDDTDSNTDTNTDTISSLASNTPPPSLPPTPPRASSPPPPLPPLGFNAFVVPDDEADIEAIHQRRQAYHDGLQARGVWEDDRQERVDEWLLRHAAHEERIGQREERARQRHEGVERGQVGHDGAHGGAAAAGLEGGGGVLVGSGLWGKGVGEGLGEKGCFWGAPCCGGVGDRVLLPVAEGWGRVWVDGGCGLWRGGCWQV
ncbi:hypothetical protein F4808DRAFT_293728 [Astrocystis sublimbata]|nr:hypothetical protein F4808DRAFT_293728 [Astrocystis sublimbata]